MNPLRAIFLTTGALSTAHTVASTPQPVGRSSSRPRLGLAFDRRQSDIDVPPQCESTCDPVITILEPQVRCRAVWDVAHGMDSPTQTCAPTLCCTALFQQGYFNCLLCVGNASNATTADFAIAQSLVDGLTVLCSKAGFPLPELTFPGQNSHRTLSTVSGSQTSAKQSQITASVVPSTLPATSNSQTTMTSVPSGDFPSTSTHSQMTVTTLPSAPLNPPNPTPTTGAVVQRHVRFGARLLSLMVAGWVML